MKKFNHEIILNWLMAIAVYYEKSWNCKKGSSTDSKFIIPNKREEKDSNAYELFPSNNKIAKTGRYANVCNALHLQIWQKEHSKAIMDHHINRTTADRRSWVLHATATYQVFIPASTTQTDSTKFRNEPPQFWLGDWLATGMILDSS